jgi:hypothetical protein
MTQYLHRHSLSASKHENPICGKPSLFALMACSCGLPGEALLAQTVTSDDISCLVRWISITNQ